LLEAFLGLPDTWFWRVGRVFGVYYLRVGLKGLSKKKKKKKNSHAMVTTFLPDNHGWGYIVVSGVN
jgi:hypothetical protein